MMGGTRVIEVDEIGVYLRDTYDFNGDQLLGYWDSKGVVTNALRFLLARDMPIRRESGGDDDTVYRVSNATFRQWRAANQGKGGDFVVFSDIAITRLPATFTVPF